MVTLRIEFFREDERLELINCLKKEYEIVTESDIKDTYDKKSKMKIQFLQIVRKN